MDILRSMYSKPPTLKVILENNQRPATILPNIKGDLVEYPTFNDTDTISGKVLIELNKNKNFEHSGVRIELIGVIENYRDKKLTSRFIALTRDLEPPGKLDNEITQLEFEFANVDKQFESYRGKHVGVRYFFLTTLNSSYKNLINEYEIVIVKPKSKVEYEKEIQTQPPLSMEVGIEDWLHVYFQVNKAKYFLRDIVLGEVVFKKVSMRLQSMELQIIKRETIGAGKLIVKIY
jgi:vacuolar protein sorting-associated protein 26